MKVPETKPVVSSSSPTSVSTPAPITKPVVKRSYPTEGLEIGEYTDQGFKVIGKTPDEGIPYIAIDENWDKQQKVLVGYWPDGQGDYITDKTAWHRAHDAEIKAAADRFRELGGTIGN